MSKEVVLIKANNGLQYATDADRENCVNWKLGQPVKVTAVKQSARSLKNHQRYWAGLVALTFDYWEVSEGMTTEAERELIHSFCRTLDNVTGGSELMTWGNDFLEKLSLSRAGKIEAPNKTKQMLHDWIKDKAGYYEVYVTPTGIKRKPMSINFNAMNEDEFKDFYKKAFNVCWKFILSSTFENEHEADQAVMQLLSVS